MKVRRGKEGQKLGVWLTYRTNGSDTVHSLFMQGAQANRLVRRINAKRRQAHIDLSSAVARCFSGVDYLHVSGAYEQEQEKPAVFVRKGTLPAEQRKDKYATEYQWREEGQNLPRGSRDRLHRMSFHAERMEEHIYVFCPITGICGRIEMPGLPIALVHTHPLSIVGNALAVMRAHFKEYKEHVATEQEKYKAPRLDLQVMAGCVLSLLRGKHLMQDEDSSSATERNMVLQQAGHSNLVHLLQAICRFWDNPNVWNKMPRLSAEWKTHALADQASVQGGNTNIGQTLQEYTRIIFSTLDPLSLSSSEQARIFQAQAERRNRIVTRHGTIKIHSASAVQATKIKEDKSTAREILETLSPHLPIVLRAKVNQTVRDLLLLPAESKSKTAFALKTAKLPAIQQALADRLANVILASQNERVFDEIGSFTNEVSPVASKSISEILAEKKEREQAKRVKQEAAEQLLHTLIEGGEHE